MQSGATNYPNVRKYLNPDFAEVSDQRIESVFESRNIDAEVLEGFLDDLGKIASSAGKTILKAAPAVLPVAGQVIGTAFGGPVGAAVGGSLGSLAGGAISSATGQRPQAPGGGMGGILGAIGGGIGLPMGLGSPAAGKLLQTVLNPQTMRALTSMALGPLGKSSIGVGGTPVPVGAFANLLGILAGRAEAEYNATVPSAGGNVPRYLQDYAGEAKGDLAVSEYRADALAELLQFTQSEQESAESAEGAEYDPREMEAIEAEYDAMERLEMEMLETEEL